MATVFKRVGGANYYAKFSYRGKQYLLSTGTTKKREADAFLADKLAEVKGHLSLDGAFDKALTMLKAIPSEKQREDKRAELIDRLRADKPNRLLLSKAFKEFASMPRKTKPSAQWLMTQQGWLNGFISWLRDHHQGVEYMDQVTPLIAQGYAQKLFDESNTARGFNSKISGFRLIWKTLRVKGGITENIWHTFDLKQDDSQGQRDLSPEDLLAVCENARGPLRFWFALGMYTGLRLKDVVTLRWSNISFRKGMIETVPAKTAKKTNRKSVTIPMHPVIVALLKELREVGGGEEYLFPQYAEMYKINKNGIRDNSRGIKRMITEHFRDCGIDTHAPGTGTQIMRDAKGKPLRDNRGKVRSKSTGATHRVVVGFHALRHTFISLCAMNKTPEAVIRDLVGHQTKAMTEIYAHANDQVKADAILALPAVEFNGEREGE